MYLSVPPTQALGEELSEILAFYSVIKSLSAACSVFDRPDGQKFLEDKIGPYSHGWGMRAIEDRPRSGQKGIT